MNVRTFLRGGAVPFLFVAHHWRIALGVIAYIALWLTPIVVVMALWPPTIITIPIVVALFFGGLVFLAAGLGCADYEWDTDHRREKQ